MTFAWRCLVLTLLAMFAIQAPATADDVAGTHTMIPMRDGVRLSAYVWLPEGDGPWPALLEQRYANISSRSTQQRYANLARQGYAVILASFRGAQQSEGMWDGYRNLGWGERQDGYDLVEWIAKQPWCNGRVGTFGGSQAGYAQNFLAITQPPHLVAQYMIDTGLSLYHEGYSIGGAPRPSRLVTRMLINCRDQSEGLTWLKRNLEHPCYDEYWHVEDCTRHFDRMNVPCFTIGSWYDFMCVGSVQSYIGRQHHGGPESRGKQKLLIGPWLHGSGTKTRTKIGDLNYPEEACFDVDVHLIRWFDHYLKGIDNGVDREPTVRYFTMGDVDRDPGTGNVWRTANDWPIPAEDTAYFLQPAGGLSVASPANDASATAYHSNPDQPCRIPTTSFPGATDAREFESQTGVVTFTTEPLAEPVEWTGLVRAELFVTCTSSDADFIVRLTDVYPDGRSILLCDAVRRGRFRDGFESEVFMQPGQVYRVAFPIGWTSQVFDRGHRIRITVASTGAEFYEVNPQTGAPVTLDPVQKTKPADITLEHAPPHASRIIAPVVKTSQP